MDESIYTAHAIERSITVPRIYTIHNLQLHKEFHEPSELHDFWELVYAENGKIYLHSDSQTYYMNRGDVYVLKPNEAHYFTGDKITGSDIFIISFACDSRDMAFFEDKILRISPESEKLIAMISAEARRTFDDTVNNPSMTRLTLRESALPGGDQIIGNLLEILLLSLIREKSSVKVRPFLSKDVFGDRLIEQILAILDEHLYGHVELSEISRRLSYSVTYLSQYFARRTHYGIIEYFNILKINEAKRLMRDTDQSLGEISRALGFCNQHYFSRIFKKYNAVAPSYYRKRFAGAKAP